MNERAKKIAITLVKIAVSVGILVYLFMTAIGNDQFSRMLETPKRWEWIVIGLVACLMAHLIGFLRWQLMVRALGLPFTTLDAVRIGFMGLFFNLVTFVGVLGGDSLRAYYVTRQVKDRIPEAISSVVADRAIGLLTMFTVATIAFVQFDGAGMAIDNPAGWVKLQNVGRCVAALTSVGYVGILVLYCSPWLAKNSWFEALMKMPKVGGVLMRLMGVVTIYRSRMGVVAVAFLLSLGVNLCFAVSIYSIAVGLTPEYPSFSSHFIIEPIAMVSNAAPIPGGIGGMELAIQFLYRAFGYEFGVIVAFAFRLVLLSISAIGGAVWFMNRNKMRRLSEAMPTKLDK